MYDVSAIGIDGINTPIFPAWETPTKRQDGSANISHLCIDSRAEVCARHVNYDMTAGEFICRPLSLAVNLEKKKRLVMMPGFVYERQVSIT